MTYIKPNTTLADFVKRTESEGCSVTGLPEGMEPADAAKKFKSVDLQVYLQESKPGEKIFVGWFPKQVMDTESNVLFTVGYNNCSPNIKVEEAAHKYLK